MSSPLQHLICWFSFFGGLLAAVASSIPVAAVESSPARPNILIILVDDMRFSGTNSNGQIVGSAQAMAGTAHAYLYIAEAMADVGTRVSQSTRSHENHSTPLR
jgi:probable HAF family extracellular repeat protein